MMILAPARRHRLLVTAVAAIASLSLIVPSPAADTEGKTVLLLAGRPSHGPGEHEHNAGVQLLARCLEQNVPGLEVITRLNGQWPEPDQLDRADTILIYADGADGHPALQADHLAQLGRAMERGAGLVCLHFAVEVPAENGGDEFKRWLGGYFELGWSVNPHWKADFARLPDHPVTRGVAPFSTQDEWYYHMRFRDGMAGITPVLTSVPPVSTLNRPDGPRSGNPAVRQAVAGGEPQHTAWAAERPGGGRGFGFTGGHFHKGWGNPDQRKLVLNAILWTAGVEVPPAGVASTVTPEELSANLDPKPAR
jgi:type 1 glutamine amidotransferase